MKAKSRITDNKIVLSSTDVKEFLTCVLCKGLLMEPFTVKECVHSFCKSCIFKYVSVNPKCPKCGTRLSSNPYDMLSPDRTLQALLIKCFPDITAANVEAEKAFNEKHGLNKRGRDEDDEEPQPSAKSRHASTPSPSSASAPPAPAPAAPPVKQTTEIRFRLHNPDIPLDKKVVFNAPRESKLKRVVPFLTKWLEQKGYNGKELTFVKDGKTLDDNTTFISLFGPVFGTQADPAVLHFVLT